MNKRATAVATLLVAVAFGAAAAPSAMADIAAPGDGPVTGIAWDRAAGALFVVGSQDGSTVAMLDEQGRKAGTVTFGAKPESTQALALAGGVLHVADIGDPGRNRSFVTVYGVAAKDGRQGYRAWDFKYPDGPHDAQAFLVSGKGRFYFITSGTNPGIYRAELNPSRDTVNKLVRAADAPSGVTDAAFLADGSTMLIRTGDGVSLVDAYAWKTTAETTYVDGPEGESITTFTTGRMLVGAEAGFRDEPLPSGTTTVTPVPVPDPTESSTSPTESATPTASQTTEESPQATPTPTPSAPGGEATGGGVSRSGTILALFGALAVAVGAGVVVFLIRN